MRPAADVIEPLEHAPLDFPLEHRGIAARRRGTLEGAPHLCRVQAECLCVHTDSVMAGAADCRSLGRAAGRHPRADLRALRRGLPTYLDGRMPSFSKRWVNLSGRHCRVEGRSLQFIAREIIACQILSNQPGPSLWS